MKKQAKLLLLLMSYLLSCSVTVTHAQISALERAQSFEGTFLEAGRLYGVDPRLLRTIGWMESRFQSRAVSPKGAGGVMQLMPATAARFGVRDRFNPHASIHGGAKYLRYLLDYFGGDVRLVLAAYNAGEGAVERYGRRIPPFKETLNYVREGIAILEGKARPPQPPGVRGARRINVINDGSSQDSAALKISAPLKRTTPESYMPEVVAMEGLPQFGSTTQP